MRPALPSRPMVLIVDDREESRYLMRCFLAADNFEVVEAAGGVEALRLLETIKPDVVLLDVCMPGMSGYEVCRAIRANGEIAKVPLILVSALADRGALAQGFAAGAVDFLAKPVRPEELCARVTVHAELNRARRELEASHARLAVLNQEKDVMFGVAAHDLRGPLSVIMGFAENGIEQCAPGSRERGTLEVILREAEQMEHFIGTLLDLEALEKGGGHLKALPVDVGEAARLAVERIEPMAVRKGLTLRVAAVPGGLRALADRHALRRILDNLVSNAVKFTPAGGRIALRVVGGENQVECVVVDSGPGLSDEDQSLAFVRFARLSARPTGGEKTTGLGLAIARALVEKLGGRIWCGNNPEGGAHFGFSLPLPRNSRGATAPGLDRGLISEPPFPHLLAERPPG